MILSYSPCQQIEHASDERDAYRSSGQREFGQGRNDETPERYLIQVDIITRYTHEVLTELEYDIGVRLVDSCSHDVLLTSSLTSVPNIR